MYCAHTFVMMQQTPFLVITTRSVLLSTLSSFLNHLDKTRRLVQLQILKAVLSFSNWSVKLTVFEENAKLWLTSGKDSEAYVNANCSCSGTVNRSVCGKRTEAEELSGRILNHGLESAREYRRCILSVTTITLIIMFVCIIDRYYFVVQ